MTECERIIKEGLLPASFFKEEVRCGFLVTQERKKVWAVLLDLMVLFDSICKKHQLKYSLYSGTMLGAVRHHGFIPWDDDVDITMPREDYEKLLQLESEFNGRYFLQTSLTDSECGFAFAKIRNSNTTAISKKFAYQKFNQGIHIDVIPLDKWEIEGGEERYYELRKLILINSTAMRKDNPHLEEEDLQRLEEWHKNNYVVKDIYLKIQSLAKHSYDSKTDFVSCALCTGPKYEKKILYSSDFNDFLMMDFEGFVFPVAKGYDRILKIQYGNYMELPKVEDRGKKHDGSVFDADTPYKDFLKREWNINV